MQRRDIYSDDLITSVDTEEEAGHVKVRTRDIFLDACTMMTKWDQSTTVNATERSLVEGGDAYWKVLGVSWQPALDVLEMCKQALAKYSVVSRD